MIDSSQVASFGAKLSTAGARIQVEEEIWAQRWGGEVVDEMVATVARDTGKLAESIAQVEPGGIEIGEDYWRFVDRGTSRMAPRPFVAPAVHRVKPRAVADAGRLAVESLTR